MMLPARVVSCRSLFVGSIRAWRTSVVMDRVLLLHGHECKLDL